MNMNLNLNLNLPSSSWIRRGALLLACTAAVACDDAGDRDASADTGMGFADDTDGDEAEDAADTAEPEEPIDPQTPEEPADPEDPEEPADPEEPIDPEGPMDPEDPMDPEEPVDPEEPQLEDDGDGPLDPAVLAQFRATAGAPVRVTGPLFNEEAIDTRGLQYVDTVSLPEDDLDVVAFRIVPGEVDPTIRLALDCDLEAPERLRATVVRDNDVVLDTFSCADGEVSLLLPQASSFDLYTVEVSLTEGPAIASEYALSINGFCFQQCNFQDL